MNNDRTGDLEYDWDGRSLLQCSSSGNQKTMVSLDDENSVFSGTLDPRLSVAMSGEIRGSFVACPSRIDSYYTCGLLESQDVSNMSSLAQYPPNLMNIESVADVPRTSSASFAGTVGVSPMVSYCQSSSHPALNVKKTKDVLNSQKCFNSCKRAREEEYVGDEDTSELSPHGKRHGTVPSTTANCQLGQCKADDIQEKKDERKDKSELNTTATVHAKTIKKVSKPAQKADAQKDVRAKRGQATSAHSLAERLRRERINERMKFLQDLVPGCNKVTGKAVMLDEIINYVQSLQRQVEFLSMKLATVYPEMKVDIEKLLLQDIHSSQDGIAALPGSGSAVTSTYSVFPVDINGQFADFCNTSLQPSPGGLMSSVWHQGQINLNQICSLSNPALRYPKPSESHDEQL